VGLLMCQILRSMGARLIGTAGGPEKCALAKENGAEFMIDYKKTDGPGWLEQVKEITKGEGVAVVYDSVGKDTWEQSLQAIRRKGKVSILFHPTPHSRQSTNKLRWCTSVPHPAPCLLSPSQS
jgi:NADPH2:quinone reductase